MSVKVMSLVWERAPYTAGSLLVLLALADWSNEEGVSWPSMERLARKARVDKRSAQRIVRQLARDGVIQIEEGGGRGKQHRYLIQVETMTKCRPLITQETMTPVSPITEINGDILNAKTVTFHAERVTSDTQTVTPMSSDPLEEPLVDPSMEPLEAQRRVKTKPLSQLTEDEFFSRLEMNPAYAGINVRALNARMITWCEVNGKRPTRRRLVNWLNREDRPMEANNGGTSRSYQPKQHVHWDSPEGVSGRHNW